MAAIKQSAKILTRAIDRVEAMREELRSIQTALESLESDANIAKKKSFNR